MISEKKWLTELLFPILFFLLAGFYVFSNVASHKQISPIDEYVYLDYSSRIFEDGVLPLGTETADIARNYISCQGVAGYGKFDPEACNTGDYSEDSEYPYAGKTSADIYTPMYFLSVASFANTFSAVWDEDFLTAARNSGVLWLGSSAVFLYLTLRKLNVTNSISFSLPVILITSLPAWWSTTFISTDATGLLAGSLGAYLLVRYLKGEIPFWILLVSGVVFTLLKFQNIMVLGVMAIVIIFSPLIKQGDPHYLSKQTLSIQKSLLLGFSLLISAIISQAIWLLIRKTMAIGVPAQQGVSNTLDINALLGETVKFMSGISWGAQTENLPGALVAQATITTWLIVGAAIGATLVQRKIGFTSTLGFSFILVATLSAPILGVVIHFVAGPYFHLPARYGIPLFPIGLIIVGMVFANHEIWRKIIFFFGIYCLTISLFQFIQI